MPTIPQLFEQLKFVEQNINIFYGNTVIRPTLNRMLNTRKKILNRILRLQIRTFNRD